jgi:hypothetical protein
VTVRPASYTLHGTRPETLPALTCGEVLDTIGAQLVGLDLASQPLEAKRDRVRAALRAKPCLVVLDNLEAVMDCGALPRWLWEMANPSKFLLTSRHWLDVAGGHSVLSLDPLGEADSMTLIRHEARQRGLPEVVKAGDGALLQIVRVTGGNPLAIRLVVGQLASLPLERALRALEGAEPGPESFYDYLHCTSWELVSQTAQRLLLKIAQLPGESSRWADLLAASGLGESDLAPAVEELTAHSLLQATGFEEKRYSLHILTRRFAARQAQRAVKAGEGDER